MIGPEAYRDARMKAPHWIEGYITEKWPCGVTVRIIRVFRGSLKFGTELYLEVNFQPGGPQLTGHPLYSDVSKFMNARFVEAFLDDRLAVSWEQIKFLRWPRWRPSGEPSVCAYDW